jgi:hypothetical protein
MVRIHFPPARVINELYRRWASMEPGRDSRFPLRSQWLIKRYTGWRLRKHWVSSETTRRSRYGRRASAGLSRPRQALYIRLVAFPRAG